jgi:hypothetical protein
MIRGKVRMPGDGRKLYRETALIYCTPETVVCITWKRR